MYYIREIFFDERFRRYNFWNLTSFKHLFLQSITYEKNILPNRRM